MVYNIVERKALEAEARELSNEVRDLELTYLSMSGKINLELSNELGFRETKARYATRKALGRATGEPFGSIKPGSDEI